MRCDRAEKYRRLMRIPRTLVSARKAEKRHNELHETLAMWGGALDPADRHYFGSFSPALEERHHELKEQLFENFLNALNEYFAYKV